MKISPQFAFLQSIILLALCFATATPSSAQTFTTLATFNGKNGRDPVGPLVQGTDASFYGTTTYGGANCNGYKQYGCGTVFKITPTGTLTTLYNFCSQPNCSDGSYPDVSLVQGTDGKFYGTTTGGGSGVGGTFFKITSKGTLTTLYNFCSQPNCADGSAPVGGLVQAANGTFYGTTAVGGLSCPQSGGGCGTVFKVTAKGKLTILYSFCSQPNCADGAVPEWGLVQATDRNFYGTTQYGGTGAGANGTVFKITAAGKLTALYSFCSQPNCTDGFGASVLAQGSDGNFYGTTQENGTNGGPGTVFKITPAGMLTTLYTFGSQPNDGLDPVGGLLRATDGNFYGTTSDGGYGGTLFRITSGGTVTTLHTFCSQPNCTDGSYPLDYPVQGTDGTFYGLTTFGGIISCDPNDSGCGTAFSLSVGLGPFIETRPTSGKIGKRVTILGTDMTGASGVTFSGTAATFKVISSTEITTRVPKGAATGFVTVTTPNGTLTSNIQFVVP